MNRLTETLPSSIPQRINYDEDGGSDLPLCLSIMLF